MNKCGGQSGSEKRGWILKPRLRRVLFWDISGSLEAELQEEEEEEEEEEAQRHVCVTRLDHVLLDPRFTSDRSHPELG